MDRPYFAHKSAILDGENESNGFTDPLIGVGSSIWHNVHIMKGAQIGPECRLGQNVFVGGSVTIGRGCKIQNNVNIYDGVTLGDNVFCGPSMTFTNLSYPIPRAAVNRHSVYQPTHVGDHASIGAGAVIVCGHNLGESCFVAAGAVVINDVPAYAMVAGNPARFIGWVCRCGNRLVFDSDTAVCTATVPADGRDTVCGLRYRKTNMGNIELIEDTRR